MGLTLADLGEDLIGRELAVHLSPNDIFSLSLTNHQLRSYLTSNDVYHLLYIKKYGSTKPTPLNLEEYNWKGLFELRSSSKVRFYTWGSSALGRLGYLISEIPSTNVQMGHFAKHVHTPSNVSNFNDFLINDISAGGFSFQILMNNGDLYHTGAGWTRSGPHNYSSPGPYHVQDYRPNFSQALSRLNMPFTANVPPRRMLPRFPHRTPVPVGNEDIAQPPNMHILPVPGPRITNPNLTLPPEQMTFPEELRGGSSTAVESKEVKESSFITKLNLPEATSEDTRIISVSSGREHFIALDNNSQIYTWDSGNIDKTGVKLLFKDLKIDNSVNYVTKISAGWNLSACHINQVGIIIWYNRKPVTKESNENGTMESEAYYVKVPYTKKIIDFIALNDFILYINEDGKLFRFNLWAEGYANGEIDSLLIEDSIEINKFNQWLIDYNNRFGGKNALYTKLSGCFNNFAIFTNDGNVLLGNKDIAQFYYEGNEDDQPEKYNPIIIDELQNQHIIHVVMGDYHYMALTDKGELLSWGMESGECGCLGLGAKDDVIKGHPDLQIEDLGVRKGMRVNKPCRVKEPNNSLENGRWMAIAAAGWHSAGLYLPLT